MLSKIVLSARTRAGTGQITFLISWHSNTYAFCSWMCSNDYIYALPH